jgi:hypothetical protein
MRRQCRPRRRPCTRHMIQRKKRAYTMARDSTTPSVHWEEWPRLQPEDERESVSAYFGGRSAVRLVDCLLRRGSLHFVDDRNLYQPSSRGRRCANHRRAIGRVSGAGLLGFSKPLAQPWPVIGETSCRRRRAWLRSTSYRTQKPPLAWRWALPSWPSASTSAARTLTRF